MRLSDYYNFNASLFLHDAIKKQQNDRFMRLLEDDIDLSYEDDYGDTSLNYAVRFNNIEALKKLLELNVDVDKVNKLNWSSLYIAFDVGNTRAFQLLVPKSKSIHAKHPYPLAHTLARSTNPYAIPFIKILIENGIDLNAEDVAGKTALDYAKSENNEEVITFLMEEGAR